MAAASSTFVVGPTPKQHEKSVLPKDTKMGIVNARVNNREWTDYLKNPFKLTSSLEDDDDDGIDAGDDPAVFRGDFTKCPMVDNRTVQLLVEGVWEDCRAEQNLLVQDVGWFMAAMCQSLKLDLDLVDVRWGAGPTIQQDYAWTGPSNLLTHELNIEGSNHPLKYRTINDCYFARLCTFLVHGKFGYISFPTEMGLEEYDDVARLFEEHNRDESLLTKWYRRNDNVVPPRMTMASVESVIQGWPHDPKSQKAFFTRTYKPMLAALTAISAELGADRRVHRHLSKSSLERDVDIAKIAKADTNGERHFVDRDGNLVPPTDYYVFTRDITHEDMSAVFRQKEQADILFETDTIPKALMEKLREALASLVSQGLAARVINHKVKWVDLALDDLSNLDYCMATTRRHEEYLLQLADTAAKSYIRSLRDIVAAQPVTKRLYLEAMIHLDESRTLLDRFAMRSDLVDKVKTYTLSDGSSVPMVLHGVSGSGRASVACLALRFLTHNTPFVGKTPKHSTSTTSAGAGVDGTMDGSEPPPPTSLPGVGIVRFAGLTNGSSTLVGLLMSITEQLLHLANTSLDCMTDDYAQLARELSWRLIDASNVCGRVVLIVTDIDKLEGLAPSAGGLDWIPMSVPDNVRIILTLESDSTDFVEVVKARVPRPFSKEQPFVEVGFPVKGDPMLMMKEFLRKEKRELTMGQSNKLSSTFARAKTCLFIWSAVVLSRQWKSDVHLTGHNTPRDDHAAMLLAQTTLCGQKYGEEVVSAVLGLLCSARNGLTCVELTDILTTDEEAMAHVLAMVRRAELLPRFPPRILRLVLRELSPFMVRRVRRDDVSVYTMAHREVAWVTMRLARDSVFGIEGGASTQERRWRQLAEYFGTDTGNPRCLGQPLMLPSGTLNARKVSEYAHALQMLGEWVRLREWLSSPPVFIQLAQEKQRVSAALLWERISANSPLTTTECIVKMVADARADRTSKRENLRLLEKAAAQFLLFSTTCPNATGVKAKREASQELFEYLLSKNKNDHEVMFQLGVLARERGDHKATLELFESALSEKRSRQVHISARHMAAALNSMATHFQETRRFTQALRLQHEALHVIDVDGIGLQMILGDTLLGLGDTMLASGDAAAAKKWYDQSYKSRVDVFGASHPEVAGPLNKMADVAVDNNAAVALQLKGTKMVAETLGHEHPLVLEWSAETTQLMCRMGRYAEALQTCQHVLKKLVETKGSADISVSVALVSMADVHALMNNDALTVKCLERAVGICEHFLSQQGEANDHAGRKRGSLFGSCGSTVDDQLRAAGVQAREKLVVQVMASGRNEEALMLCDRNLFLLTKIFPRGHRMVFENIGLIARVAFRAANYENVLLLITNMIAYAAEHGIDITPDETIEQCKLRALALAQLLEFKMALVSFRFALTTAVKHFGETSLQARSCKRDVGDMEEVLFTLHDCGNADCQQYERQPGDFESCRGCGAFVCCSDKCFEAARTRGEHPRHCNSHATLM